MKPEIESPLAAAYRTRLRALQREERLKATIGIAIASALFFAGVIAGYFLKHLTNL